MSPILVLLGAFFIFSVMMIVFGIIAKGIKTGTLNPNPLPMSRTLDIFVYKHEPSNTV